MRARASAASRCAQIPAAPFLHGGRGAWRGPFARHCAGAGAFGVWLALLACQAPPREAASGPCSDTEECRGYGWCGVTLSGCRPTDDAHCRASAECRGFGRCALSLGACVAADVADCAASDDCAASGRCGLDGQAKLCAATGVGCANSLACRMQGACELVGAHCAPASEAHCRASDRCTRFGQCRLVSGACGT